MFSSTTIAPRMTRPAAIAPVKLVKTFSENVSALSLAFVLGSGVAASNAWAGSVNLVAPTSATAAAPVHVEFQVDGMTVKPASEGVIPGTGHFHLLVDAEDFFPAGKVIQFDDAHKHYGKGQTAVDISLPAGSHKLTLQFANALHESYGPEYAQTTKILIE